MVTSGARQKDEDWNPEENGGFAVHGQFLALLAVCKVLPHSLSDTDKESITVDPLAALEKTTEAKNHMESVAKPRIESLQSVSEHFNSDPYSLSLKARKKFREEKKIELGKRQADDALKGRYALPTTLRLLEDDAEATEEAKKQWETGQQEHRLKESKRRKIAQEIPSVLVSSLRPSGSTSAAKTKAPPSASLAALRTRILNNTAKSSGSRRAGG